MKSLIEACRRCILTGTAATLVIAPWFLYCLHTFGTIRQASGAMKMLWRSGRSRRPWMGKPSRRVRRTIRTLAGLCLALDLGKRFRHRRDHGRRLDRPLHRGLGLHRCAVRRKFAEPSLAPCLPSPIRCCTCSSRAWSIRYSSPTCNAGIWPCPIWKCIWSSPFSAASFGKRPHPTIERSRWPAKALAVAIVFTVVGLVRYGLTLEKGYWAWQRDVYASIGPVDRLTPEGARIGCFNAGIPGYYSRRKIINLDGLVNNAIVPYWRAKNFERYLIDARINAIYDEDLSLTRAEEFSHGLPELDVIAKYPLTNYVVDTRYLWMLKPSVATAEQAGALRSCGDKRTRTALSDPRSAHGVVCRSARRAPGPEPADCRLPIC